MAGRSSSRSDAGYGGQQPQELALGQQAAPRMAQEVGGLDPSPERQAFIDEVEHTLVQSSDTQTVNAFALPGGPIFITKALLASASGGSRPRRDSRMASRA